MIKNMTRGMTVAAICIAFFGGLWLTPITSKAQATSWTVNVYGNKDLSPPAVWVGISSTINYTWGAGAPVINGTPTGAPVDNFSVSFATSAFFSAGTYRFTVKVDDGAKLYVDGFLLINEWKDGTFRTVEADYTFTTDGNHNIVVEMYDGVGDSSIIASWAVAVGPLPTQGSTTGGYTGSGIPWNANFFGNTDLSGTAVFSTTYAPSGLNLNWGQGSPNAAVPADNFSARFTRTLTTPTDIATGEYVFYIKGDDGFRLIIDQTTLVDSWGAKNDTLTQVNVTLADGPHNIIVEYREFTVDAYVFMTWTPPNAQSPALAPDGATGATTGTTTTTTAQTAPVVSVTATVKSSVLNVRDAPSTAANVVAKINKDTSHTVVGRTADMTWAQLSITGGGGGWCAAQYLTFSGDFSQIPITFEAPAAPALPPPSARGMVMGNLRLREGPSTRTRKIDLMPWGTNVDILGKDAGHAWYQVIFNGKVGWAYAPWIKLTEGTFVVLPYTDGTQPVYAPPAPVTGVIAQAYGNMRIRSGPGFQYPKLTRVVWGTRVQVLAISTDRRWYKVQYGDIVGWTSASWYRIVQGDLSSMPVTNM